MTDEFDRFDEEWRGEWEKRRAKLRRIDSNYRYAEHCALDDQLGKVDSNYRAAEHRALDDRLIEEMEAQEKPEAKRARPV